MHTLNVPYISQFDDKIKNIYKTRGCGFACLCMILEYFNIKLIFDDITRFIEKDKILNEKQLWDHKGIISIAQNNGLYGYRMNYSYIYSIPVIVSYAFKLFLETLSIKSIRMLLQTIFYTKINGSINDIKRIISLKIPVIASMKPEYLQQETDTHLVVIVGYDDDNFFVHDPHTHGPHSNISYKDFQNKWTKRTIVIFQ